MATLWRAKLANYLMPSASHSSLGSASIIKHLDSFAVASPKWVQYRSRPAGLEPWPPMHSLMAAAIKSPTNLIGLIATAHSAHREQTVSYTHLTLPTILR